MSTGAGVFSARVHWNVHTLLHLNRVLWGSYYVYSQTYLCQLYLVV